MSTAAAFAALQCAGTLRKLSASYRQSAREYPKYAEQDTREAERLKASSRFYARFSRSLGGPRLPS